MSIYDQWTTECPRCHNQAHHLTVVEATLAATGRTIYPDTPLYPNGFEVPLSIYRGKDASTEDEKVRCDNCGEIFELSDLALKEEKE